MTAVSIPATGAKAVAEPVVELKRRTVDDVLIGLGAIVTVVLFVASGLLFWGASFAHDTVHRELSSQKIVFGDAASLKAEGRSDLVKYAGQNVTTGPQANAYASYINGHLKTEIGKGTPYVGKTYAELGGPWFAAQDKVAALQKAGAPASKIAAAQDELATITQVRSTLFTGETLRGLLLTAYAWATIGRIAWIAGWVALVAAAAMLVLVILGAVHHHRISKALKAQPQS
jgi:hypothetical protein